MVSHGSLNKAGRVRRNCPLDFSTHEKNKNNVPKWHKKPHKNPKCSKRRNYEKRELLGRKAGQNSIPRIRTRRERLVYGKYTKPL